jgi:hypothetical protein
MAATKMPPSPAITIYLTCNEIDLRALSHARCAYDFDQIMHLLLDPCLTCRFVMIFIFSAILRNPHLCCLLFGPWFSVDSCCFRVDRVGLNLCLFDLKLLVLYLKVGRQSVTTLAHCKSRSMVKVHGAPMCGFGN